MLRERCLGLMPVWRLSMLPFRSRVGARCVVYGLCGVVGLSWWADVPRLCEFLRWFPALVLACVCMPSYRVSL